MKILVTGSRTLTDRRLVTRAADDCYDYCNIAGTDLTVVVGDCPTGADLFVRQWLADSVHLEGASVHAEIHTAEWETYGITADPRRNAQMVQSIRDYPGKKLVVALPRGQSKGTRGCLAMAEREGLETAVL